ncbi:MAG: arylsulfatase [Planctomycetota bacterium]|nr:arylsulfatase [Planctomycetota bacterium]
MKTDGVEILLVICAVTVIGGPASATEFSATEFSAKPNVVLILADDMGLGDVQCFGKGKSRAETPHLDRLARVGTMFTDAHAPGAHCIPTRVAILTGRYKFRYERAKRFGPWGFLYPQFPQDQSTLATMFKRSGYQSAYIGKWHLGLEMKTRDGKNQGPENVDYSKPFSQGPNDRGFDESFILPGSLDMYPYVFARNQVWVGNVGSRKGWSAFNRVGPAADDFEDFKVLDTFSKQAEQYIERQAGSPNPFFLYCSLTAPHTPTSPSPKFRGKSQLGLYGDFIMETDDCVGRILNALERYQLDRNTIVVFTSDHGAASYAGNIAKATIGQYKLMQKRGHYSSGIYRGFKFSAYEGGTRVPLIVRWPAKTKPGTVCNELVALNDLMATFAEILGVELAPEDAPDSIGFRSLIENPSSKSSRKFMICRSTNNFTIREGDWKLLLCPGSGCNGNWGNEPKRDDAWKQSVQDFGRAPLKSEIRSSAFCQLYNLRSDPTESRNLAKQYPVKIKRLGDLLDRVLDNGRSTPGPKLANDRKFNPINDVPKFVWENR